MSLILSPTLLLYTSNPPLKLCSGEPSGAAVWFTMAHRRKYVAFNLSGKIWMSMTPFLPPLKLARSARHVNGGQK
jgi:hypothetical protein